MTKKVGLIILFILFSGFVFADCNEEQVDINTASVEDLDLIKWVGEATAEAIVAARPFSSVDDLIRVSGIGDTKLQDIKSQGLACVSVNNVDLNTPQNLSDEEEYEEVTFDEMGLEEYLNEPEEEMKEADEDREKIQVEVINYSIVNKRKPINSTLNKIILNPKDIKTYSLKQKQGISINDYALGGFVIFSIVVVVLVVFRFRRFNKNEFK